MNRFVIVFVFTGLLVAPALSQDMSDVIVVTDAEGGQQFPDVAYNSTDNTFLAVWEERIEDRFHEIWGVVLNGDTGEPMMEPFLIVEDIGGVEAPEVAYNSAANEFLVVARVTAGEIAVAQRVGAAGSLLDVLVDLGHSGGPTFFDPAARARVVSAVYNARDDRYLIGLSGDPTAQIVFPNLDLDIPIERFGSGTNPAVAWSSQSNVYLVAWEDREQRPTEAENLSAVLIGANGNLMGETIRIRDQRFAEESPRIAYNPDDDQFLVIWDERIGFSDNLDPQTLTDTMGQLIGADGNPIGDPIPIERGTAYTLRQDVDYSAELGLYLAVWKGDPSGDFSFADIYGRFIGRDGSLQSDIFLIFEGGDDASENLGDERYYDESKLPVVATNTQSGDFLVVWEEAGAEGDPEQRDIMARFVRAPESDVSDWQLY